jgi:hypothetical protein
MLTPRQRWVVSIMTNTGVFVAGVVVGLLLQSKDSKGIDTSAPSSDPPSTPGLRAKVGEIVVIEGRTGNAKAGAMLSVKGEELPVYLQDTVAWDNESCDLVVRLSGRLQYYSAEPKPDQASIQGGYFVLEKPIKVLWTERNDKKRATD